MKSHFIILVHFLNFFSQFHSFLMVPKFFLVFPGVAEFCDTWTYRQIDAAPIIIKIINELLLLTLLLIVIIIAENIVKKEEEKRVKMVRIKGLLPSDDESDERLIHSNDDTIRDDDDDDIGDGANKNNLYSPDDDESSDENLNPEDRLYGDDSTEINSPPENKRDVIFSRIRQVSGLDWLFEVFVLG